MDCTGSACACDCAPWLAVLEDCCTEGLLLLIRAACGFLVKRPVLSVMTLGEQQGSRVAKIEASRETDLDYMYGSTPSGTFVRSHILSNTRDTHQATDIREEVLEHARRACTAARKNNRLWMRSHSRPGMTERGLKSWQIDCSTSNVDL